MIVYKRVALPGERRVVMHMVAFKLEPSVLDIVRALVRPVLENQFTALVIAEPDDI